MTYILLYRGVREGTPRQVFSGASKEILETHARKLKKTHGYHLRGFTYYPYEERKPLFE
jgi:hypothetical protein